MILAVVFYIHIHTLFYRYIYRASRKLRGAGGKYKYEMSVTVQNATREDEGMYTCRMEREEDRAYVSSWITQGPKQTRPTVELISCANKPDKKQRGSRGQFPDRCERWYTRIDCSISERDDLNSVLKIQSRRDSTEGMIFNQLKMFG